MRPPYLNARATATAGHRYAKRENNNVNVRAGHAWLGAVYRKCAGGSQAVCVQARAHQGEWLRIGRRTCRRRGPSRTFSCQRDARWAELLLAGVQTVTQRSFAALGGGGRGKQGDVESQDRETK